MSKSSRYPDITDMSLAVILAARPGSEITRESVDRALTNWRAFTLTGDDFAHVKADLSRAHMIDENNLLTPLADNYARMWRQHFAKQAKQDRP